MAKKINPLRVALLGSYPPPYGGVSIHIRRLKDKLEEKGVDCVVYDFLGGQKDIPDGKVVMVRTPLKWLLKYFFTAKEDIVHVHTSNWQLRVAIGLMRLRGKKTIISIHGESLKDSLRKGSWVRRQMIKFALKSSSFVICANTDIRELVLSLGIRPGRIETIPAFIPPVVKKGDITKIPQEVWGFIDNHTPVISAGAFRINFHNGQDTYGIDMCIELCSNLKSIYPKIGLVFHLPDIGNYDYFSKMKQRIAEKGIENNFLFITQPLDEVYPIWQKSDIFVRPTVSEGDAVSLREALYLKTPSVASDVVSRPEGTVLFKSRSVKDFVARVKMVWDNYAYYKSEMESVEAGNGLNKMLRVYSSLANKKQD